MIVGHIGGSSSGGYEIQKSLRFRASASAYLSRTPSVAGNRKTWTWSGWVKRGTLGVVSRLFSADDGSASTDQDYNALFFNSSDQLQFGGNLTNFRITTAVYRDPSAWYHIVLATDTTQATAANRFRLYVNGSEVTAFGTSNNPSQNTDLAVNASIGHYIGSIAGSSYFDGYMTEVNFIDGQALGPSYFGEFSAETGSWIPKKYTGTYGTNGFYLPFNDGSTLGNLAADRSGNGNNWTASNISLTAGVTYDWMDDTPSNNFAVLNPLRVGNIGTTPTMGNLRFFGQTSAGGGTSMAAVGGTLHVSSGKWYCEFEPLMMIGHQLGIGFVDTSCNFVGAFWNNFSTYWWTMFGGTPVGAPAFANNDKLAIAIDMDAGKVWFAKNGTWILSGDPATGASPAYTFSGKTLQPFVCDYNDDTNSAIVDANFGQRPFAYTPPTGFKALNTQNLPEPTIKKGNQYFDVSLYTGTNANQTVVNSGAMQPDFVWLKIRGNSGNHVLFDSVRGANKKLSSSMTAAEETPTVGTGLLSFNSNGFSLVTDIAGVTGGASNTSPYAFVGWQWKAGGAPVTNNAGSIQSQVSANPQAGFSIVTYTGTGANATVGHGLGVAPKMVIVKGRTGTANDWAVWHTALTAAEALFLNLTIAKQTGVSAWNSTLPTSSLFSLGVSNPVNTNGNNYVAYCFAEVPGFSKIGSYTGNGSADGPFVYCGFRPRFVLIKNASNGTATWIMWDSARDTYNVERNQLYPNQAAAEVVDAANNTLDFLSNGFKFRGASTVGNGSGNTIVFIAFAEAPFKYSNAR